MITQAQVLELYNYKDGELYWKKITNKKVKIGSKAGGNSINSDGRKSISVNGKRYLASRIIFLHQNGYLPAMIDHINGIKTDNRIENLRPATRSENNLNKIAQKNSKSGIKNVSWHKASNKWVVQYKGKHHGCFVDLEEAKKIALQISEISV